MNGIEKDLLKIIADIDGVTGGALNIRANGSLAERHVTENVDIRNKTDKDGIDIIIRPGTKGETIHIPVIISESGVNDLVYNDFIHNSIIFLICFCSILTSDKSIKNHFSNLSNLSESMSKSA